MLRQAIGAADKELIAIHICAVVIHIARKVAMPASGNRRSFIIGNGDRHSVIKDKQLAFPVLVSFLKTVADDAAI